MPATATAIPGLSSLGIKFGYAVELTANTKPAAFTQLERCNQIGGIELPTETIDASALEDYFTRYVAGRQDTGGEWTVTFNLTTDVYTQLTTMISAYQTARASELNTWFEVWIPDMTNAFFVVAQPPLVLPMPEMGQNELLTIELTFTINDYKGMSTAIEPALGG